MADDHKQIEDLVNRVLFNNTEIDIKESSEEIQILNNRYRRALTDKIKVYDQLVQAVKTLADRNSVFMRNEVELCRLSNMTSITKLELDQKEKAI